MLVLVFKLLSDSYSRQRTVQQLVDQHKVVLDGLLVKLAKVPLSQLDQPVEELKDQRGIGVALGDGHQVDVFVLDMAKGRAPERQDGRPHLGIGDDLDAEDVGKARPAVVAKGAEDEVLALLVEDEHAGEHLCGEGIKEKKEKEKEKRGPDRWQELALLVFCRDEVATAIAVRLGARLVRGLGELQAQRVLEPRQGA